MAWQPRDSSHPRQKLPTQLHTPYPDDRQPRDSCHPRQKLSTQLHTPCPMNSNTVAINASQGGGSNSSTGAWESSTSSSPIPHDSLCESMHLQPLWTPGHQPKPLRDKIAGYALGSDLWMRLYLPLTSQCSGNILKCIQVKGEGG